MQAAIAAATFIGVILLIITEWIHLTVAAFLGPLILVLTHVMTLNDAIEYIGRSHGTLGLFFGVMVMVRAFEPTKVFDYLATQMVLLAKGKGKNLLLGIVAITTPICAVLPNATTVMLLAPLISPAAVALLGAALAMLLAHQSKIDSVNNILRDLDGSTLLFFMSIFVLIGGLEKTGVIAGMSGILAVILGKNIFLGSLTLLFFVGLMSSVVPNIPL